MNRQCVLYVLYRMCGEKSLSQEWNGRSDRQYVLSTYCSVTNHYYFFPSTLSAHRSHYLFVIITSTAPYLHISKSSQRFIHFQPSRIPTLCLFIISERASIFISSSYPREHRRDIHLFPYQAYPYFPSPNQASSTLSVYLFAWFREQFLYRLP